MMFTQGRPFVSRVVALFLLSQVFLIITHAPLVHTLAWIILNADSAAISDDDQAHKLTALAQVKACSKKGLGKIIEFHE
jgi:CLEC16A C-terminal